MKKLLSLATVVILGFAGSAHAATLITLSSGTTTYSAGGTLTPNVSLSSLSPSQLALTGDASLVSGTVAGQYVAPDGGADFGGNYLAVIAVPGPPGSATYSVGQNMFGFTWGTVDDYNTLTIHATDGTYTITGDELAAGISGAGLGPVTLHSSDEDVVFKDTAGTILSAVFTTTQNSFEVANFESAVPLPAAFPLFGSALFGMWALARRRKAI